jgi:hypothetical protein
VSAKKRNVYLGDGAYLDFDGWALTVWCERGDGRHYVVLEPQVYRKLVEEAATLPGYAAESGATGTDRAMRERDEAIAVIRQAHDNGTVAKCSCRLCSDAT